MEHVITQKSLATETWFIEMLAGKGFAKSSENTFTNGKAQIRVDGTQFIADPGAESTTYKADFRNANRQTVTIMVDQMLKMHAFRSDDDLTQERAEKKSADQALAGIALTIKEGPETGGGMQLRKFLWSLYNMHHVVNLWRLTADLDNERAGWVAEIFAGALNGLIKEKDVKRALEAAGEMKRWDMEQPSDNVLAELQDAENIIVGLMRKAPPSRTHTVLVSLQRRIAEAKQELREENSQMPARRIASRKTSQF